ncbi:hypothetical protein [Vibrio harveyi]|uniref:hypothetical protein n=1 Tax=Vibrio harveyi TaxID=669 RepID=UPI0039091253
MSIEQGNQTISMSHPATQGLTNLQKVITVISNRWEDDELPTIKNDELVEFIQTTCKEHNVEFSEVMTLLLKEYFMPSCGCY